MRYSKLLAADTYIRQRETTCVTLRPSDEEENGLDGARRDPH
ncbi:hypothetical protein [Candidatus Palauibacter sp.]